MDAAGGQLMEMAGLDRRRACANSWQQAQSDELTSGSPRADDAADPARLRSRAAVRARCCGRWCRASCWTRSRRRLRADSARRSAPRAVSMGATARCAFSPSWTRARAATGAGVLHARRGGRELPRHRRRGRRQLRRRPRQVAGLQACRRPGAAARRPCRRVLHLGSRRRPLQHGDAGAGDARPTAAAAAGLEVEPLDGDALPRLLQAEPDLLHAHGAAPGRAASRAASSRTHDWIVATTYPTSRSIGELAEAYGDAAARRLATFRTPVGFKYFAALVGQISRISSPTMPRSAPRTDVTGAATDFGPDPRLLIMAEESGGAAMGPAEPMQQPRRRAAPAWRRRRRTACRSACMALGLAARLHREGGSFAGYYLRLLEEYDIALAFLRTPRRHPVRRVAQGRRARGGPGRGQPCARRRPWPSSRR